jgi:hypothetical protein
VSCLLLAVGRVAADSYACYVASLLTTSASDVTPAALQACRDVRSVGVRGGYGSEGMTGMTLVSRVMWCNAAALSLAPSPSRKP